ncbi:DNA methyltransferase [Labilibaculum sp.]|uniref:DNA methyltransferase n=1 Tax=Labilibaculum sp. TaxID=2060723 RepID=UPI0035659C7E
MKATPDNFYDLAIVDPPYGLGIDGQKESKKGKKSDRKGHAQKDWDNAIPKAEYFEQLFRVSKNQIIWGGNYFVEHLKEGHKGWIIWDKAQHGLTMSDCELAYSSFDCPTRIYTKNRAILLQEGTIHPTQKPKHLYRWLLQNYANKGDKILDTNGGSMTIALACHDEKFDIDICEIDADYFKKGTEQYELHKRQLQLF